MSRVMQRGRDVPQAQPGTSSPDRTHRNTQMPASGKPSTQSWTNLDAYEAEVIVLLAYVKLSFGTYQAGQDWAATLMPFKNCELRLINPVQSAQRQCVLCVELF